jgi:hypothetical protein
MRTNRFKILSTFIFGLLACWKTHAGEQDNWYLHGPIDSNLSGVFHQEYNATAKKDMLYRNVSGLGLEVRDINGTLLQTINTGGVTFTDIEYDQNASRLFGINASKLTCFEQNASGGWSEEWRSTQSVSTMAQGPSGKLFCANNGNKIYVFEQNGTMSSEFGYVDGIISLSGYAKITGFAPSGTLVLRGRLSISGGSSSFRTFYFRENGEHIRNWHSSSYDNSSYLTHARISPSGILAIRGDSSGQEYMFHPDGATLTDPNIRVSLWLQNGDFISGSNLYRRTFRTKMETNHNSVPQPVIHRIAQRSGTNVMELDFEVIDTDDDNVTVGILAYCGSDKLVPQAWLNGTGSKIGTPIATNTVHTMEWDVKQDWSNSTGAIKFEILCQDGSRDKPVDLHFLKLPFADGNMTISRSPLKDSDFVNYAKFLLATGQAQFESNTSNAVVLPAVEGNATDVYTFTNCGASGRNGPTESQIQAEYNGTNLNGNVTTGWKAGYQEWTVPASGNYYIQAWGAGGGSGGGYNAGSGAIVFGSFDLNIGDKLSILVGQQGSSNSGGSGGGGTFVVDTNGNTKLIIAGGGGGSGSGGGDSGKGGSRDAVVTGNGVDGAKYSNDAFGAGGKNGGAGDTAKSNNWHGFGGSGYYVDANDSKSFLNGGQGGLGYNNSNGGFGGGGGGGQWGAGGGGGYSGGGNSIRHAVGGGGGSYNASTNPVNIFLTNLGHGKVIIYGGQGITPPIPTKVLLDNSWNPKPASKYLLLEHLGRNYKFATSEQVTKAREAATPGGVNNWTATNQVKPRNLPGKVNEYGFDVSTTEGLWVIKE